MQRRCRNAAGTVRRLLAAIAAAGIWLSSATALAQAQPPDGPQAGAAESGITALRGEFSVSYAFDWLGGAAAPNAGPLVRADVSFASGPRQLSLQADPAGIRRHGLTVEVREGSELLSVSHERTPSDGTDPNRGARTDFQVLAVTRPAATATVQAMVVSQVTEGAAGNSSLLARLAASDRYRDPLAGVSSIDWRVSAQTTNLQVPQAAINRTTASLGFGVGMAMGGPQARSLRPNLRVDLSRDLGASDANQRLRLAGGLVLEASRSESVTTSVTWDFAPSGTSNSQSLSVVTDRLAPLRFDAEVDRSQAASGATAYRWGSGLDLPLGRLLQVGASYRGELDEDGSGHGGRGRLGLRWTTPGFTLRSSLEGGVIWRSSGEIRPDLSFSLVAAAAGDGPLNGTLAASLRYDRQLSAALTSEFRLRLGRLTVDVDAELSYADVLAASGGVVTAFDLVDRGDSRIALQLGVDGRVTGGGTAAASLDLGLRYGFGAR